MLSRISEPNSFLSETDSFLSSDSNLSLGLDESVLGADSVNIIVVAEIIPLSPSIASFIGSETLVSRLD